MALSLDVFEDTAKCAKPGCDTRFVPVRSSDRYCPDHKGYRKPAQRTRKTSAVACPGCGKIHVPHRIREYWPDRCEECFRPPFVKYALGKLHVYQSYDALVHAMTKGPLSHHFVAVDGEGTGQGDQHRYLLLGLGNSEPLINRNGIRLGDALRYLYEHYHRNAVYVSFYFTYDLSQLLNELDWDRARMVFTHEGVIKRQRKNRDGKPIPHAMPHPMEFLDHTGQRWQFDALQGKARRIRFRPRNCDCTRKTKGIVHPDTECAHQKNVPWFVICDVADFFNDTLLNIVERDPCVATPDELRLLREGKENRNSAELDKSMILYNRTENILLARIMDRVKSALAVVGIYLDKDEWIGMGQAAQKWMDQQPHILTRDTFLSDNHSFTHEAFDIAQASYYGGLIENIAHGIVPGETWCYDRNSAYCADMRSLPCLYHAKLIVHDGEPGPLPVGHLRIEHVTVAAPDSYWIPTGPLQYRERKSGIIKRPLRTSGWHWSDEIDAADAAGLIRYRQTDKWLEIVPQCDCLAPFERITTFYRLRKMCRKGSIEERVYKMLPSAVYGKLAQSAGESKYGNPLYASLITSRCRTELLRVLGRYLDDTVMIVQDAIYTRHRHPELIGSELGEWKEDGPITNLTIVAPQFHYHDGHREQIREGTNPAIKAKGVRTQDDRAQVITQCDAGFGAWDQNTSWRNVTWPQIKLISDFDVITPQQAARFGNWTLCGRVRNHTEFKIGTHPGKKRATKLGAFRYSERLEAFVSTPYLAGEGNVMESTPYGKEFGFEPNELDIENLGNTPEGPRGLRLREGIR